MQSKLLLAALFTFIATATPSLAANSARSGTMSGVMSDDMCKGQHSAMMKNATAAQCTNACIKGGSKLVLVDDKSKKCYHLMGKGNLSSFAGKHVSVAGHIDDASNMIHVHNMSAK